MWRLAVLGLYILLGACHSFDTTGISASPVGSLNEISFNSAESSQFNLNDPGSDETGQPPPVGLNSNHKEEFILPQDDLDPQVRKIDDINNISPEIIPQKQQNSLDQEGEPVDSPDSSTDEGDNSEYEDEEADDEEDEDLFAALDEEQVEEGQREEEDDELQIPVHPGDDLDSSVTIVEEIVVQQTIFDKEEEEEEELSEVKNAESSSSIEEPMKGEVHNMHIVEEGGGVCAEAVDQVEVSTTLAAEQVNTDEEEDIIQSSIHTAAEEAAHELASEVMSQTGEDQEQQQTSQGTHLPGSVRYYQSTTTTSATVELQEQSVVSSPSRLLTLVRNKATSLTQVLPPRRVLEVGLKTYALLTAAYFSGMALLVVIVPLLAG